MDDIEEYLFQPTAWCKYVRPMLKSIYLFNPVGLFSMNHGFRSILLIFWEKNN